MTVITNQVKNWLQQLGHNQLSVSNCLTFLWTYNVGVITAIVMIQKSRWALRHLDHVIDRQNSGWPRLLTASSRKMLQTNHVPHWHDWVSTDMIGQRASTLPVYGQWQHAGHVPPDYPNIKRSEIGHARYIGHASSRFPEIMHRWNIVFVLYSLSKFFYANRAIKPPSQIIGWSFIM